jgi:hypothetical protein
MFKIYEAAPSRTNINTTAVYLQFNDRDLQDVYANVPFYASNRLTMKNLLTRSIKDSNS